MRDASFVDAFEYAGVYARENKLVAERGFFNIGRREGLKMTFLEASEQIPQTIDWYVQAISSAIGVYGNYKAAKELYQLKRIKHLPKLLCVQPSSYTHLPAHETKANNVCRLLLEKRQKSSISRLIPYKILSPKHTTPVPNTSMPVLFYKSPIPRDRPLSRSP